MYQNVLCLPTPRDTHQSATVLLLVKIYVLGQKYQMPSLRNDALDGLVFYMLWGTVDYSLITPEVLTYAWQNTSASCPLRCFLLALIRIYFTIPHLEEMRGKIGSMDFWIDLSIHLLDKHDEQDEHDHQDNCLTMSGEEERQEWWGRVCSRYHIHILSNVFGGCSEGKDVTWYKERDD
jgi:hypothetical protein